MMEPQRNVALARGAMGHSDHHVYVGPGDSSSDDDSTVSDISLDTAFQHDLAPETSNAQVPFSFLGESTLVVHTKERQQHLKEENEFTLDDVDGSDFMQGKFSRDFQKAKKASDPLLMSPNPFFDKLDWPKEESDTQLDDPAAQATTPKLKKKKKEKSKKEKSSKRDAYKRSKSAHDVFDIQEEEPITLADVRRHRKQLLNKGSLTLKDITDGVGGQGLGQTKGIKQHRNPLSFTEERLDWSPPRLKDDSKKLVTGSFRTPRASPHSATSRPSLLNESNHSHGGEKKISASRPSLSSSSNHSYGSEKKISASLLSGSNHSHGSEKKTPPPTDRRAAMLRQNSITMSGNRVDIMIMPMASAPKTPDRRSAMARSKSVTALGISPGRASTRNLMELETPRPEPGSERFRPQTAPTRRRGLLRAMSERGGFSIPKPAGRRPSIGSADTIQEEHPPKELQIPPSYVGELESTMQQCRGSMGKDGRRAILRRATSERGLLGQSHSKYDALESPNVEQLSLSDHHRTSFH